MSETLNIKNNGSRAYICISELPLDEQEPFKKRPLLEGARTTSY